MSPGIVVNLRISSLAVANEQSREEFDEEKQGLSVLMDFDFGNRECWKSFLVWGEQPTLLPLEPNFRHAFLFL